MKNTKKRRLERLDMGKGKKKSKTKSNEPTGQAPAGDTQGMQDQKPERNASQKRMFTSDDEIGIKNDEKERSDRRVSDIGSDQDRSHSREYQGSRYNNRGESDANRNKTFGRRSEPNKRSERVDDRRDKPRYSGGNDYKRIARDRSHSGGRNYRSPRDYRQDREFIAYQKEFDSHRGNTEYVKTKEIVGNLFNMSKEYSLAHCVAEDMNMGSGIAVQFRRDFKCVDVLLNQRQRTGGLAILKHEGRFIYYLVTKRFSWGKPTNATLFASLKRLREHVIENGVKLIAMPRIGCGLDRLEWDEVRFMVEFLFQEVDVEITICNLEMTEDSPQQKFRNCKTTNVLYPIQDIEETTVILYFSSEDGFISEEMAKLDDKFQHLREFRIARLSLGNVVFYTKKPSYLLCGCIVRKSEKDPFDFEALQKCVASVQKENKKTKFYYVAFQAFRDPDDPSLNYKIINLLRNSLRDVEVYVCWPGDLQNEMAPKDRFDDYSSAGGAKSADKDGVSFRQSSDGRDWRTGDKRTTQYSNRSAEKGDRGWGNEKTETNQSKKSGSWENDSSWQPEKPESDESKNSSSGQNDSYWDPEKTETDGSKNSSSWQNVGLWDSKLGNQQNDNSFGNPGTTEESTAKIDRKAIDEEPQNYLSRNRSRQTSTQFWCEDEDQMSVLTSQGKDKELNQSTEVESMSLSSGTEKSEEAEDREYLQFENKLQGNLLECKLVKEQTNQKSLKNYSRVCFAREDMVVVGGVPDGPDVSLQVGKLLNQNRTVGGLAHVSEGTGFCYFLIVQTPNSPLNYRPIFSAIRNLRNHVQGNFIKKLLIPKMEPGGSDKFDWSKVNYMFQFFFGRGNVEINCARSDPAYDVVSLQKKNKSELKHGKNGIHQMKKKSVILYLASVEDYFTEEMNSLAKKFPDFREDFVKKTKSLGDVIQYKENEDYVLYGCVVKLKHTDNIDFENLRQCVVQVNNRNLKQEKLPNVGIQAVNDDQEWTNYKIATTLLNCLQEVTISMCWPGNLRTKMPPNRS